ncbi:hypothetical protein HS7_13600 [Sulfolobales archaeon HS-7]|nr:hypothetical protein HS7_13600 [Sulfolobales archaeon HS-7]
MFTELTVYSPVDNKIMVLYSDENEIRAGVPLGGIGTGKIEINNKGKMINVTIFNNRGFPIRKVRGFHILIIPDHGEPFFLERELPFLTLNYEPNRLLYEGSYPFFTLTGEKGNVVAKVRGFSPIIPHNLHDSTLPAVGFKVELNTHGSVAISFPNIVGSNPIGRINELREEKVLFRNPKAFDVDPRKGEVVIMGKASTVVQQYNLDVRPEIALKRNVWEEKYESDDVWKSLLKREVPKSNVHEVTGFWDSPASLLVFRYEGEPVKFVLSWYVTGKHLQYPYGSYYHNNFSDASEVAEYFYDNFDRLESESGFLKYIPEELPEWLRDAIANSAYTLSSNTVLDERGRFSIYESPENCPYLGTIAALCYEGGSLPILLFYPELEKSFLKMMGDTMRNGYVPHDLGLHSLDHPADGTTAPPPWKDTNPTFVLLIYRYYKFTRDLNFLAEMYPKMIEAIRWEASAGREGVPELEGQGDTGFDAMSIKGLDSYTTSLYIASLEALKQSAKVFNDGETEKWVSSLLKKAREKFEQLYNGNYFKPWEGEPKVDGIFLGQFIGQWWAEILELDSVSDEDKISSSLEFALKISHTSSPHCTPNLVGTDGKILDFSVQAYSSWPRLVFSTGWIGSKRNKAWFDVIKKEWDNLVKRGLVWNQPSRINGFTGEPESPSYLDHYIGNSSIWSFVII